MDERGIAKAHFGPRLLNGRLGELLRLEGHSVIGVDVEKLDGVGERLDGFVEADLNEGLPKRLAAISM